MLGIGARPGEPLAMFSFWKTTVPVPEQKKKLLVDDSVLVDVFGRMEGKHEPSEIRFRFVLALILMRKRLLKYEGMRREGRAGEIGGVADGAPRGGEAAVQVVNPRLTEEQISKSASSCRRFWRKKFDVGADQCTGDEGWHFPRRLARGGSCSGSWRRRVGWDSAELSWRDLAVHWIRRAVC